LSKDEKQKEETRGGHCCCSVNIGIERTSGLPPSLRVYQNILQRGLLSQICLSWFKILVVQPIANHSLLEDKAGLPRAELSSFVFPSLSVLFIKISPYTWNYILFILEL